MIQSINYGALAPGDSMTAQYDWETNAARHYPDYLCGRFFSGSTDIKQLVLVWAANKFEPQSVVINEIMYDPLPNRSEFIELFNRSADTVDLHGWTMMNAPSSSGRRATIRISDSPLFLPPNEYAVIGADSSLITQFPVLSVLTTAKLVIANKDLSLNNSGDDVVLLDVDEYSNRQRTVFSVVAQSYAEHFDNRKISRTHQPFSRQQRPEKLEFVDCCREVQPPESAIVFLRCRFLRRHILPFRPTRSRRTTTALKIFLRSNILCLPRHR